MTPELNRLLSEILRREEIGTLFLGKGGRLRRVFFAGDRVHLLEVGKQCRLVPASSIRENDQISPRALQELVREVRRSRQSFALLLRDRGLLSDPEIEELLRREELEELGFVLAKNKTHFVFEEGSVPEEILLPTSHPQSGIAVDAFVEFLRGREREEQEFSTAFPSRDEVVVLSEAGAQAAQAGEEWLFSQVAGLIDGFRSIAQVLKDGILFPHCTGRVLMEAATRGWIKKTRFPDLQGIIVAKLSPLEMQELIPRFERAIEMAVEDLPYRRTLATLYAKTDCVEKCLLQLHHIGDVHFRNNEIPRALVVYQEALQVDPQSMLIKERVFAAYERLADAERERGDRDRERQYLEDAIRYKGGEFSSYIRIIETYQDEGEVVQALPRLVKLIQAQAPDRLSEHFYPALLERFPNSIPIRKRYINFLLDRELNERAIQELQSLAGDLLDRGLFEEARKIYLKMGRLAPEKVDQYTLKQMGAAGQSKAPKKKGRRWRPSVLLRLALLIVFSLCAYQFFVFALLSQLNRQVHAITESPIPPLGSPPHGQLQRDTSDLLHEYRAFQKRHFLGIWAQEAEKAEGMLQNRLDFMEQVTQLSLSDLYAKAERYEIFGRLGEARDAYQEIVQKGEGTEWVGRARKRLGQLATYQQESERLLREGRRWSEQENFAQAFTGYQQLLLNYPRSEAARTVLLPIRIQTTPPNAELRSDRPVRQRDPVVHESPPEITALGRSPTVIWVDPVEAIELTVTAAGYKPAVIVLESPKDHEFFVPLSRED